MRRSILAVDVQSYYRPAQGMVDSINQLAGQHPTIATLFKHNESMVPLTKLGKRQGPADDQCLVHTSHIVPRYGYTIPPAVIEWIESQMTDEVLSVGGHTDACVLAAGFSLFDAGLKPAIVPMLCYGNDWFMHTVTTGIWEQEIGKVYESVAELKFAL